ncbi:hypothetical protein ACQP1G_09030 [Nocardia sp. CA-107356]|uniref:hypothetical protein n=1 Tax=Nocardia sp. CA-107356 TaxID=3239972 RepID=UPI003D917427
MSTGLVELPRSVCTTAELTSRCRWLDLAVLLSIGGRERTAAEYGDLLARGGLRLRRVVATAGPHSIIEAVPDVGEN